MKIQSKNLNRVILKHLNINSICNKSNLLTEDLSGNVDIIMISETKTNKNFQQYNFYIGSYTPPYTL